MPTRIAQPKPPTYPHSDHELTPTEVRALYGPLLDRFYRAITDDLGFLATLAEKANEVAARQERHRQASIREAQRRRERAEAQREITNTNTPDAKRAVT